MAIITCEEISELRNNWKNFWRSGKGGNEKMGLCAPYMASSLLIAGGFFILVFAASQLESAFGIILQTFMFMAILGFSFVLLSFHITRMSFCVFCIAGLFFLSANILSIHKMIDIRNQFQEWAIINGEKYETREAAEKAFMVSLIKPEQEKKWAETLASWKRDYK